MSARHRKPRTVSNVAQFGADMSAIHELINRHAMQLYTGGEHYCALADLHELLCTVTLTVSGEPELPWVAAMRGFALRSRWCGPIFSCIMIRVLPLHGALAVDVIEDQADHQLRH